VAACNLSREGVILGLSFQDRLGLPVDREVTLRKDRRQTQLLLQASLRLQAFVEDLDFRSPRGMVQSVILRLATCDWIRRH
jgi:hypothetical protein